MINKNVRKRQKDDVFDIFHLIDFEFEQCLLSDPVWFWIEFSHVLIKLELF